MVLTNDLDNKIYVADVYLHQGKKMLSIHPTSKEIIFSLDEIRNILDQISFVIDEADTDDEDDLEDLENI